MLDLIAQLSQENDRLQAELAQLRESEKRYRTLFELSSEGIMRFGYKQPIPVTLSIEEQVELCYRSNYIAEANDAFAQMYEYEKAEDIIGLTLNDFHDRNSAATQAMMRDWVKNQYACRSAETVEIDRHGRKRYFLNSAASTIENGCVVCTWVSQVDITQLRETQQALLEAEQARSQELERINIQLQQTLDRLIESEERFRTLFELSSEGFYYIEVVPPCPVTLPIEEQCDLLYQNIRVVKANPAFAAIYGVEHPDELIGLTNADVHVAGSPKNAAFIRGTVENGYHFRNLETEEIDTQGQLRYFLNSGVYTIKDGCIIGGWGTQIDITQLREAQQALLEAQQQRAAELAKANDALKRSLTMLALEPSLDKLLGYVLQAISDSLGDRSGAVYLFDDSNDTTTLHLNYENGQLQQGGQINHPAATGHRSPQEWDTQYLPLLRQNQVLIHHESEFASPAYAPYRQHNAQRGIKTLLFVPLLFGEQLLGSITLRSTQHRSYTLEELELARALAHQATLAIQLTRLAARECDRAILEERNRMARDIHDSLAQAFTGIILQLEAAKRKIAVTQSEAAQNCLSRARSLAVSGLSEARRSVRALRPEALESDDLPSALRYIVEQMSWDTSVQITLQIDGAPRPIPVDVEVNLLRIGQEAITNALRHANAENIRLNLLFEPQAVHLQIRDDGQGFEPQAQLSNGGFGLIGMQERSRQIGGQLRLVSSIGQGTEAIVTVPI